MTTTAGRDRDVARLTFQGGALMLAAAAVGVIGLALCAVGLFVDRRQAFHSYLAAFAFAASFPLGALLFLMTGHVVGSKWFVTYRRITEAVVGAFPILVVLFIPIALGVHELYPWSNPVAGGDAELRELMAHKRPYLNVPFFVIRTGVYFAVWIGLGTFLRRWSLRQDRDPALSFDAPRAVSGLGLPVIAITMTFAAIDWMMSLMPQWFSAAFGLYYFSGAVVGALAVITVCAVAANRGALAAALGESHFHAIGRLLFSFVIVWAYIAYSQGFLIWIANKPGEVIWYVARVRGGWGWMTVFLILGNFGLPFFLMLPRQSKRRAPLLTAMSVWLLVVHFIDVYWLVLPALHEHVTIHWLDFAALAGVGGITLAFALFRLRGQPILPVGDPRLAEGLRYVTS